MYFPKFSKDCLFRKGSLDNNLIHLLFLWYYISFTMEENFDILVRKDKLQQLKVNHQEMLIL